MRLDLALGLALSAGALVPAAAASAQVAHPVIVTAEQAEGGIFTAPKAIARDRNGVATQWFEMLRSGDGSSAGIYSATASNTDIEAYPHDEFMYFLEGGVTLTSADGDVMQVTAGDGVVIPKGWKGNWTTSGYRKFYVTYGVPK